MFKIDKYVKLTRILPPFKAIRFACTRNDNCCKQCPPRYECVQPEEEEDWVEELKRKSVHPFFKKECPKDYRPWRNLFCYICFPIIIFLFVDLFFLKNEKKKRQIFIEYDYMRIRRKGFPWDDERTLFHNPRYNALPSGYEFEVPEDEEYDPRVPV